MRVPFVYMYVIGQVYRDEKNSVFVTENVRFSDDDYHLPNFVSSKPRNFTF